MARGDVGAGEVMLAFLLGAVAGAAVALLYAPASGQETRDFLTWITGLFNDGLFPPGATTWDGAGDNTAYQSGNALFIANPGSVYLYMRDNDPDLGEATKYSALPAGPELQIAPQGPNLRAVSSTSQNQELAMDLLKYLADDEFMKEYYFNAIYGPVLNSQTDFPI